MAGAWIEVFKAGKHTSGNGITKEYSKDDLDAIASGYNENEHKAPLVLGHPKTNSPAYGWTKSLKRVGEKLIAYVDEVSAPVVEAVKNGHYKKVSIALYGDGRLRHIGLLGATPPAIKGLADVQFNEEDEFEEYAWATYESRVPIIGRVLSGIRDILVEKFGLEMTDKSIDKGDIDQLHDYPSTTYINESEPNANNNYSEEEGKMNEEMKQKIADLEGKLAAQSVEFSEKMGELKTNLTTAIDRLTNMVDGQIKASEAATQEAVLNSAKTTFASFCEDQIKDGKVLPAEKDSLMEEYSELLIAERTLTFSEGTVKPSEKMKIRLAARPVVFGTSRKSFASQDRAGSKKDNALAEYGELDVDPLSIEIDSEIRAYAEEHKCSYEVAAAAYASA